MGREVWITGSSGGQGKRWFSIPGAGHGAELSFYKSLSLPTNGKTASLIYDGKAYVRKLHL